MNKAHITHNGTEANRPFICFVLVTYASMLITESNITYSALSDVCCHSLCARYMSLPVTSTYLHISAARRAKETMGGGEKESE